MFTGNCENLQNQCGSCTQVCSIYLSSIDTSMFFSMFDFDKAAKIYWKSHLELFSENVGKRSYMYHCHTNPLPDQK